MKKNLKNLSKQIDNFFSDTPTSNQKAWGVINQFYHLILTYMDENNITQADLARKLDKSRSAISQLFSKTPNISIKKMVEIADAVGISIEISSSDVALSKRNMATIEHFTIPYLKSNWIDINSEGQFLELDFELPKIEEGISIPVDIIGEYSNTYLN